MPLLPFLFRVQSLRLLPLAVMAFCAVACSSSRQATIKVEPTRDLSSRPSDLNGGYPLLVDVVVDVGDGTPSEDVVKTSKDWFTKDTSPSRRIGTLAGDNRVLSQTIDGLRIFRFRFVPNDATTVSARAADSTPFVEDIKKIWVFANFREAPAGTGLMKLTAGQTSVARNGGVTVALGVDAIDDGSQPKSR
jgi:hypothetical protein